MVDKQMALDGCNRDLIQSGIDVSVEIHLNVSERATHPEDQVNVKTTLRLRKRQFNGPCCVRNVSLNNRTFLSKFSSQVNRTVNE